MRILALPAADKRVLESEPANQRDEGLGGHG